MPLHSTLSPASLLNHLDKPYRFCLVGYGFSRECQVPHFHDIQKGVWSGPPNRIDPFRSADHATLVRDWFEWRKSLIRARRDAPPYRALARLQSVLGLRVATQCVDGLAGFNGVAEVKELYGNVFAARCRQCGHGWRADFEAQHAGTCPHCGGALWPDVAMFDWNRRDRITERCIDSPPTRTLVLQIGEEPELAPYPALSAAAMKGVTCLRLTADGAVLTRDDTCGHLPIKAIEAEIAKQPWPASLPGLPNQKCLYRSVLCLLGLLTHREATGSVAIHD